jgi:hypothetical protein
VNRITAITGQLRLPIENAEVIAGRIGRYLESLADLDPLFYRWTRLGRRSRSTVPAAVTMPPDEAELRTWIVENRVFASRNGRKQHIGYSIRAMTPQTNCIGADFWLAVDFSESAWWLLNRVGVTFFGEGDSSTKRSPQGTIDFLRRALLNLATIWDCDWAAVAEGDFRWDGGMRPLDVPMPRYRSGWLVYLDGSLTTRIAEPRDVTTEKFDNGAVLLTAVRDDVFNPLGNPVHNAAALRIQMALAPLNDVTD